VAGLSFERGPRAAADLPQQLTPRIAEELLSRLLDGHIVPAPELRSLLQQAAHTLAALPTVVDLPPLSTGSEESLTVVGDLHGQLVDLAAVFDAAGYPSDTNRFIFNGDFIDRGQYGVEVLAVRSRAAWLPIISP